MKAWSLDCTYYNSNSFYISTALFAAEVGISDAQIRALRRSKCNAFLQYIRMRKIIPNTLSYSLQLSFICPNLYWPKHWIISSARKINYIERINFKNLYKEILFVLSEKQFKPLEIFKLLIQLYISHIVSLLTSHHALLHIATLKE